MSAAHDRTDDSFEAPVPETSKRRHREQAQIDFELDFFAKVLQHDPLYSDALRVHADNLAAKGHYNRALEADLQLVRLHPLKSVPWYNLACSYALLGMTDPAFEALERSLRLGYPNIAHVRRDRDLKSLRTDPRFVRLLRRY